MNGAVTTLATGPCRKLVVAQLTRMAEAYIELAAIPVGKNVGPVLTLHSTLLQFYVFS